MTLLFHYFKIGDAKTILETVVKCTKLRFHLQTKQQNTSKRATTTQLVARHVPKRHYTRQKKLDSF